MASEQVTINLAAETPSQTLEQQAIAMGIDPSTVDANETSQTASSKPPILGKFKTAEDLERAYVELEKKLGSNNNKSTPADSTVQDGETESDTSTDDDDDTSTESVKSAEDLAKEATGKAGLDLGEMSKKYWAQGESLEDSDYAALAKAGYPNELVNSFIAGEKAKVALQRSTVMVEVGGEDTYATMTDWAAKSMSEAEVGAYNDAVNGSDMTKVMLAVKGLKARFEANRGSEPSRTIEGRGGSSSNNGNSIYSSVRELMTDMGKPEYQKDPAYRARIEQKLSRSNIM